MIDITIVEDEDEPAEHLSHLLNDYASSHQLNFQVRRYKDGISYLTECSKDSDILFLDIMMPGIDGIALAEKIRQKNKTSILIFVTNMHQFAIKGYKVNAMDYLIKPLDDSYFLSLMDRVIQHLQNNKNKTILIKNGKKSWQIFTKDIKYVEVLHHKLIFHTDNGLISAWGSLDEIEKEIASNSFARCNSCYLVNLHYVNMVDKDDVMIGEERLKISRSKKAYFYTAIALYCGKGNN